MRTGAVASLATGAAVVVAVAGVVASVRHETPPQRLKVTPASPHPDDPSPPAVTYATPPPNSLEHRLWRFRGTVPYLEAERTGSRLWSGRRGFEPKHMLMQPLMSAALPSGGHVFVFQANLLADDVAHTAVLVRHPASPGQLVMDEVVPLDTPVVIARVPDAGGELVLVLGEPATRVIEYAADGARFEQPAAVAGDPAQGWLIFRRAPGASGDRVRTARCAGCEASYDGPP